ncbi:MAG TPA: helix-turn-helix transcriptional regulator [Acidimicrobiales bacterium]
MPGNTFLRVEFGKRLNSIREERGLTQEKLAALAGMHRTYYGAVERGERNVSIDNIGKLAYALDVSLSELFEGVAAQPPRRGGARR